MPPGSLPGGGFIIPDTGEKKGNKKWKIVF